MLHACHTLTPSQAEPHTPSGRALLPLTAQASHSNQVKHTEVWEQDGRDAAEQAEQPQPQRLLHHGAHPGDICRGGGSDQDRQAQSGRPRRLRECHKARLLDPLYLVWGLLRNAVGVELRGWDEQAGCWQAMLYPSGKGPYKHFSLATCWDMGLSSKEHAQAMFSLTCTQVHIHEATGRHALD